jgi:hypothetical protein
MTMIGEDQNSQNLAQKARPPGFEPGTLGLEVLSALV